MPAGARPPFKEFEAIWDTGATSSVISQGVVDACGLKPTGMVKVQGVHGVGLAETFLVNFGLPNGVAYSNVKVTKGDLAGAHVLIGMDIIATGDFSITNVAKKTVFSFRFPSSRTVDFVEDAKHAGRSATKKERKANKHKKPWQR